ncbi:MAG: SctF chaperone SctG [Chlamydiia bacterium]|nr:SctF chaperone SctG [Chlamydiia bacterium]
MSIDTLLEPYDEDFPTFIEAGFMAVNQKDEVNAKRCFEAARLLRKESAAPIIGLGYIALNKLEVKKAVEYFEQATKMDPENTLAKAFLGVAYLLVEKKRAEGERLIKEAKEASDDPTIANLEDISLEWAEKDLSKKGRSTPFFEGEKGKS